MHFAQITNGTLAIAITFKNPVELLLISFLLIIQGSSKSWQLYV